MRLWLSKLAMPAAVRRTNAPSAISIITTSTIARWSFTEASLATVGHGQVVRLDSVRSTQDVARDMPVGSVVVADHQTEGRGRMERRWEAPSGTALLVSFELRPSPVLSLAAGVAAAEACGPRVRLKWPNDLLLDDRKLGGILVEASAYKAVCGIGINLTWAPEAAARLDQPRDEVLERLRQEIDRWTAAPADRVLDRWRELSATLGRRVRIDGTEGIAEDLGPNGELIVDGHSFVAGSVTHL